VITATMKAMWREIVRLIKARWPDARLTPAGISAFLILALLGTLAVAFINAFVQGWFETPKTSERPPQGKTTSTPVRARPAPTGEIIVEVPVLDLSTSFHRAPRADDVAGMRRTMRALIRACGEQCTQFQHTPFWHGDAEYHYPTPRDFSVPTFQTGNVQSFEDYCSFPNRQAAWAMLAVPLKAALAAHGINPRRRDAAARLVALSQAAPAANLSPIERQSYWTARAYVERGEFPSVGAIYADTHSFRRGVMPDSPLARAREIVDFLRAHPFPTRELWGQNVSVVLRNAWSADVTVTGISVQLLGYGNYYPAEGDAPEVTAVPLPQRIAASGTDSFRIDRLLRRGVGPGATRDFPEPLNLEAGRPLRRDVHLLSDAGGFFVWRIGFRLGDGSTVWAPQRCHFAFAPELLED
jgi:hypothetical protein